MPHGLIRANKALGALCFWVLLCGGTSVVFGTAPPNDDCSGAEVIPASGPFPYLTAVEGNIASAGIVGDPPPPSCQNNVSRSIWYSFTPSANADYLLSTCATETQTTVDDTVTAIYTTTGGCGGTLTQVPTAGTTQGCDDDSCGVEGNQARIHTTLQAGQQYFVLIWKFGAGAPAANNFAVQLRVDQITAPANDLCTAAIPLALDTPEDGSTFEAENDYTLTGSSCFTGLGQTSSTATGRDVVYSFTAPTAGNYSFRLSQFETAANLVLYAASACPVTAPPATVDCFAASNRTVPGFAEEITCLPLAAGQKILLFVDSHAQVAGSPFRIEATRCVMEAEGNNTPATANPAVQGIEGAINPAGDVDFFALGTPGAGGRLFVLLDGAAAGDPDFDLRVTTPTDTLEYDDANNDTFFGGNSANIAGVPLVAGSIFLRVSHFNAAASSEPYRIYYAVQSDITNATIETEPNDALAQANFSTRNYFRGTLAGPAPSTDVDVYAFTAVAGDVVFLSLDGDPLRDNTPLNGALALLDSSGNTLVAVNDAGSSSNTTTGSGSLTSTTPNSPSEGLVYRIKTAGNYYARVAVGTTSAIPSGTGDYLLSIAKNGAVGRPKITAYGVTSSGDLFQFSTANPAITVTVGNLGFTPEAIDFRPGTQQLYALDVGDTTTQLYKVDRTTAAVTPVGPGFPSTQFGPPSGYDLVGATIGFDFNPRTLQPDGSVRIRVVSSNGTNLRLNSDTGLITSVDVPLAFAGGDVHDGDTPSVDGAAYINSEFSTPPADGTTVLYDTDYTADALLTQDPANNGALHTVGPFGVALNALAEIGFDIYTQGGDDSGLGDYAFAVLKQPAINHRLFDVDLTTGTISNGRLVGGGDFTGGFAILPPAPSATLSIGDASVVEGTGGSKNLAFTVSLAAASAVPVNVKVSTANSSATAGSDYSALSNVLVSFTPGEVSKQVNVPITTDATPEPDEIFFVNLTDAQNAVIGDAQAKGTIQNDDVPGISIVTRTNGTNNNAPPGPSVPVGSTVTFTYVVTNTGNDPLSAVTVVDNHGTPGSPGDDFNATFVSGDTNSNGLLDVSETFTFTASRIATAGQYTNVGKASGTPGLGMPVTATDPDNHFGSVPPTPTPTPSPTSTATATATAAATPKATATATATPKATATATPKPTATATPKATATPTATATGTPKPTATPAATPTATVTPSATPKPGLVGNVSTRLPVGTGNNVLIEGFIVQGPSGSTKKIMIRAIGPSLLPFGITDALANPTLEIRNSSNALIASNNDWKNTQLGGIITSSQSAEITASGLAPGNDLESAIIANLAPGSYTAVVRGVGNTVGTGVVDAYDLSSASPARLANIATRGLIQPGDKLMIAGFIIQNGPVRAVLLAAGPSLSAFGINNALPDTTLQLRNQNGTKVRENDDWQSDQKAELQATGLQPSDLKEAAVIVNLPPGQYTAQVRGKPEATGIGVVQVFFLQ